VDFAFHRFLIYIEIKNIGTTPAHDVRVTFDKPLETTLNNRPDLNEASVLKDPIPMLAPGRNIRLTFDVGHQRFEREDLPLRYSVKLKYTDGRKRRFDDPPYPLDLTPYRHSAVAPKGIPEVAQELEEIRKELHRWTDGFSGLNVNVTDRYRMKSREVRPYIRAEGQRIRKSEGWFAYARWLWTRTLRVYGWQE
jgi:hypothetical protein